MGMDSGEYDVVETYGGGDVVRRQETAVGGLLSPCPIAALPIMKCPFSFMVSVECHFSFTPIAECPFSSVIGGIECPFSCML